MILLNSITLTAEQWDTLGRLDLVQDESMFPPQGVVFVAAPDGGVRVAMTDAEIVPVERALRVAKDHAAGMLAAGKCTSETAQDLRRLWEVFTL